MTILQEALTYIKKQAPNFHAKIGLILGSGLTMLSDELKNPIIIPFSDIPGLPKSTDVAGHKGQFTLGYFNEVPVVCLGRLHLYEGVSYQAIALLIRIVRGLGCENLLITNASGSLRADVGPGDLMLITDHINFQPGNPLVGPNDDSVGPRFVGMDTVYDIGLRNLIHDLAHALNIPIAEGVYISVLGPCFETPAEIRAFRTLGADAVGMSTVPEVIAARHCGLKVAVIAAITNYAAGMVPDAILSHEHTLHHAKAAAGDLMRLILVTIEALADA